MSNELNIKNGFISNDNSSITGNLTVSSNVIIPQSSTGTTTLNYKSSPYYKTVITNTFSDQVFYFDKYIELFWDATTTDDIELTILTNPSVSRAHVIRSNITNGTVQVFDLDSGSGRTPIDPEMLNDDKSEITIWAPSDNSWPFYRITVVKSNANYTNTPAYVLIERFN